MTGCNYIIAFFLNSIYFYLCNIPLIVLYLIPYGFNITPESKYILIPTLFFIGPAYTALCGSMDKILRYGDVSFFKDYFISYKKGFKQSIIVWSVIMFIIGIFYADIKFFSHLSVGYIFVRFFSVLIGVMILAAMFIFPYIARFDLKLVDVLKLSIFYGVTKINRSILIVFVFLLGLLAFEISPVFTIPFLPGVYCYLTMRILYPILKEIEEKIVSEDEKDKKYLLKEIVNN